MNETPYHRILRASDRHRWYKPLLVLLIAGGIYAGLVVVLIITMFAVMLSSGDPAALLADPAAFEQLASANNPVGMAFLLVSVILMWPPASAAIRMIYGRGAPRRISASLFSVAGGMRWRRLGRYFVVAVVVIGASLGIDVLVNGAPTWALDDEALLLLAIALGLVAFQATAEEVVFRGLFMNVIGSWLRHPAWAVLVPVPLFVVGHMYDAVGLTDIAVFAVAAGYLTIRTRGLEAAIALHVVNNAMAFGFGIATGADLDATEIAPAAAAVSIATTLVYVAVVEWMERRSTPETPVEPSPS
ncbi:CPBP family intramembrane glutamic endopeptidase [Zhihengliuella salsuginis]|uniref:CAAX amino protease n=1 Tax=Zhihengliuella salsuginis TaxID=578222 RepID=A0ABQ3GIG7_9MICC|nr:CPBP family intramembrane glutamic endopeptidase [Zhihengliuella salsuginis]GHD05504.1 CAAX amino protease [Zhihengliuella salsuginis]